LIDPQVLANRLGHLLRVTGDHRDLHPAVLQGFHGGAGFGADLVLDGHRTDDLTVADNMEHTGPTPGPGAGGVCELGRGGEVELAQHVRPAHEDLSAIDSGPNPPAGGGIETSCTNLPTGGLRM